MADDDVTVVLDGEGAIVTTGSGALLAPISSPAASGGDPARGWLQSIFSSAIESFFPEREVFPARAAPSVKFY